LCWPDKRLRSIPLYVKTIDRITFDERVMGDQPCLRGPLVTAGMIVDLVAAGSDQPRTTSLQAISGTGKSL
jgi:hypothetical protein